MKTLVFWFSLLAMFVRAQAASTTVYSVVVSNSPVFDLSLIYSCHGQYLEEARMLEFYVKHLASGRIGGTGVVAYANPDFSFVGEGNLKGRYRSSISGDEAAFVFRAPLRGTNSGGVPLHGAFRFSAVYEQESPTNLLSWGTNVVCISGMDCTGDFVTFFVNPRLRNWLLSLHVERVGTQFTGTGELKLINYRFSPTNIVGRTLGYQARGRFDERTGQAVVHLRGIGEGRGSSFSIESNGESAVQRIRGRVLGQPVDAVGPFEILFPPAE
jgi:hypothetical protein